MLKLDNIKSINQYWQLLVFAVFFLGYITFSFYLNMNGIPTSTFEMPLIVGLGLVVSFYIGFILLFSTIQLTAIEKISFSFLPIVILNLLNSLTITFILMILIGFSFVIGVFKDIESETTEDSKEKVRNFYDYTFLLPLPFLLFGFHWSYSLLYITTFSYIHLFNKSIKIKKSLLIFGIFTLIISMSYVIALFINYNGLKVINLEKKNVNFIYKNKTYNSTMAYENSDYIFLVDNNKTISISKQKIDSKISYTTHIDRSNQIMKNIEYIKGFINE